MVAFNKFNAFVEDVTEKVHNLQADAVKVMLTNTAPVATNAVKADITELGAGNGYTTGGAAATLISSSQSGGVYTLKLNNVSWTASGGSFGPFRYAVLYNSTPAAGNLIGWYDYGSNLTVTSGNAFQVVFNAAGVFTLT